jgi:site-specific DNA-methyltransferase (adenine-specific)
MNKVKSEVFNMDCMVAMAQFPDKYFELAIVDPPYGIGEDGLSNHSRGGKSKNGKMIKPTLYTPKSWDKSPTTDDYFNELFRVSKNQIIWGANHFLGKNSSCWIVWDKLNVGTDFADCELAWTSFKTAVRKVTYRWNGMLQGNLINSRDNHLKEIRIHPTQKPVQLYKWQLRNYAKAGDKILDTHLGSGSSRIAAYDGGFDFTGYEIDKEYFDASVKRFENHIKQLKLEFV